MLVSVAARDEGEFKDVFPLSGLKFWVTFRCAFSGDNYYQFNVQVKGRDTWDDVKI